MMKEQRLNYPIPLLGRMLNASASGYYTWVDRPLITTGPGGDTPGA